MTVCQSTVDAITSQGLLPHRVNESFDDFFRRTQYHSSSKETVNLSSIGGSLSNDELLWRGHPKGVLFGKSLQTIPAVEGFEYHSFGEHSVRARFLKSGADMETRGAFDVLQME